MGLGVRIDVQLSINAHPACLQDGRFLAQFYICHPADKKYNVILIRPSANSESYAEAEGLRPFSQWIRLINADTYIAGPFDFAEVNGRKTRDRISRDQWLILAKF